MTSRNGDGRNALVKSAAAHLRAALKGGTNGETYGTPDMIAAAEDLIAIRRTFTRRDGLPDLTGGSYAYRRTVAEVLTEAGVSSEQRPRVQATLRYHIGNLLREQLSPEEIEQFGLVKESPREASARARDHRGRMWAAMSDPEDSVTDPEAAVERLLAAGNLIATINVDWSSAPPMQRQMAEMAFARLAEMVEDLTP